MKGWFVTKIQLSHFQFVVGFPWLSTDSHNWRNETRQTLHSIHWRKRSLESDNKTWRWTNTQWKGDILTLVHVVFYSSLFFLNFLTGPWAHKQQEHGQRFVFPFLQGSKIQLDILVENMGRVNVLQVMNRQRKGRRIYFTLFESGYFLCRGKENSNADNVCWELYSGAPGVQRATKPEGHQAPYTCRKEKKTHELIFSWLLCLAVLFVCAYARRYGVVQDGSHTPANRLTSITWPYRGLSL